MSRGKPMGQIAYEARERDLPYPLPAWDGLAVTEQRAWTRVARAVIAATRAEALKAYGKTYR